MTTSRVPGDAIDNAGNDLVQPVQGLLRELNLLPKKGESANVLSTPDSVAVIESGATAVAKWWTAGIAAAAGGSTLTIRGSWETLGKGSEWNQPFALLAVGIILAAAAAGISYLLGSDVRGRAAASTATIQARQSVAISMITQAADASKSALADSSDPKPTAPWIVSLPALGAKNLPRKGADEPGWTALAVRTGEEGNSEVLLAKGAELEWVLATNVEFV